VKKHLCVCILFFSYCLIGGELFAEAPQTSKTVNTAAAVRSIERATGFLGTSDWQQAAFEARLGSSYDPSIADFSYIEALSLAASGSPRADILERVAYSLSSGLFWRSYTKNDALVFAARLQAQTCDYKSALSSLDKLSKGFSSADADYVRISSFYGLGQINDARRLVSSSLERWPFDSRFPRIFLQREAARKTDALSLKIASTILSRLYIWENDDRELMLLAVPFETDSAQRERNIRIFRNMGKTDSASAPLPSLASDHLSSVYALEYGIIDENAAVDEIFSSSKTGIRLSELASLCKLTGSSTVRARIASLLDSYEGIVTDDSNGDGIVESFVQYRLGRPVHAEFDRDQDGYPDYTVECNLGTPTTITGRKGASVIMYDTYPSVRSVKIENREYTLKPLALSWAPVEWIRQNFALGGNDFFTIRLTRSEPALTARLLGSAAAFYEEPVADRPNAFTRVTLESGIPVSSESRENGRVYARTSYARGYPRSAVADRDGDGYFETTSLYDARGILSQVMVDGNANRIVEYKEQYSSDGVVKMMWDSDENGVFEISQTSSNGGTVRTEWLHPVTGTPVVAIVENDSPRSVQYAGKTLPVIKDPLSSVWWVGRIPGETRDFVKEIENTFNPASPTVVSCIVTVGQKRVVAVRTGGLIFAELLDE